jgi:hypothetical protein
MYIADLPARYCLTKAICLPSGDHAGEKSEGKYSLTVLALGLYQGGLSQLRPVSVISQLSTALLPENRVKTVSGHVARSPVGARYR